MYLNWDNQADSQVIQALDPGLCLLDYVMSEVDNGGVLDTKLIIHLTVRLFHS